MKLSIPKFYLYQGKRDEGFPIVLPGGQHAWCLFSKFLLSTDYQIHPKACRGLEIGGEYKPENLAGFLRSLSSIKDVKDALIVRDLEPSGREFYCIKASELLKLVESGETEAEFELLDVYRDQEPNEQPLPFSVQRGQTMPDDQLPWQPQHRDLCERAEQLLGEAKAIRDCRNPMSPLDLPLTDHGNFSFPSEHPFKLEIKFQDTLMGFRMCVEDYLESYRKAKDGEIESPPGVSPYPSGQDLIEGIDEFERRYQEHCCRGKI